MLTIIETVEDLFSALANLDGEATLVTADGHKMDLEEATAEVDRLSDDIALGRFVSLMTGWELSL